MRHVVIPQAIRNVGPPLLNDFISLQKDVALISIIGVSGEAFRIAQIQASTDFNYTPLLRRRGPLPRGDDPARANARPLGPGAGPMSTPVIAISGITKAFGDREVLKGIDLAHRRAPGGRA